MGSKRGIQPKCYGYSLIEHKTSLPSDQNKKGTIWNIEKIAPNHVEIKSIGGKEYHKNSELMIKEFREYCKLFDETLQKDSNEHKKMYEEHKRKVEQSPKEVSAEFATALSEAGII